MKRSDVFPSQYLGKDDLAQPVTTIIDVVRIQTIKGDGADEDKPVLYFRSKIVKPMILNNTNWSIIEEAYGEESDDWAGKPIELYVDPMVMFGGKRVGGVRVRVPANGFNSPKYTLAEAYAACERVGISKDELKAEFKKRGMTSFSGDEHSKLINQLIDAKKGVGEQLQDSFEESFDEEEIPT